ncbi:hypothetical protein [Streptomyces sp. NPDC091294]|uniref:TRADD-N-associated membrane domain-containing protein n=1 Tax=Streptomyces sp. NPDC091294 TaxID=3365992 RepID=UPI00381BFE30
MTDEQPTGRDRTDSALPRWRTPAVIALGGCSTAISVIIVWHEWEPPTPALFVVAAVVAGIWVLLNLFLTYVTGDGLVIAESRARVREAEQGVEAALGGANIMSSHTFVITADHVTVPAQVSGETEEPPPAEDTASRQERRDLALSRLWALTQARLTLYHDIATKQARRSFLSAQASMILGFGMLAVFVYLALKVSNTTGAVVAGGLGAVSAALAGFISKTFVKSQQTAAEHLKAYFDQPLEFSRYLAAERVLTDATLPDEKRAEIVAELVRTIASGPAGPAPADTKALLEQLQDLVPGQ